MYNYVKLQLPNNGEKTRKMCYEKIKGLTYTGTVDEQDCSCPSVNKISLIYMYSALQLRFKLQHDT